MRVIVGYVPVIHTGYLQLFAKYEGSDLFVLGEEFLAEEAHLARDMRALPPETIATFANTLPTVGSARVLGKEDLGKLLRYSNVTLPDEEISRTFAQNHLADVQDRVVFEQVFLRWDRMVSTANREIEGVRCEKLEGVKHELMHRAVTASYLSSDWWRRIGALASRDGQVLSVSFNHHYPSEHSPYITGDPRSNFNAGEFIDRSTALHAEMGIVVQAASSNLSLRDADVFVTTFPCPPCATALAACRIKRLYYLEGYSLVAARQILESASVEIVHAIENPPS